MPRLDDLISLIRTVNEVYFITAPERVKAAYLLVDDIVELACKTFLQEKTLEWRENCRAALIAANFINPTSNGHRKAFDRFCEDEINMSELCQKLGQTNQTSVEYCINQFPNLNHWSANHPEFFIEFEAVINEVKQEFASSSSVQTLLDEAFNRHKTRNKFYHDHQQAGLTINDERCLKALCEMFDLMDKFFPSFRDEIKKNENATVRCQIGVLRLKQIALTGQMELSQPYTSALEQIKKGHRFDMEHRSLEHSLVHTVSDRFFRALCEQFKNKVAELQTRIDRINSMPRPQQRHRDEKTDKQQFIQTLQGQLDQINALLGTP